MDTSKMQCKTIDEYIATLPTETQIIIQNIRKTIQQAAPEATEAISYGMPTFKLNGKNVIHFAGYKEHIGIYPTASKVEESIPAAAQYRTGKGTFQFLLKEAFPYELVANIVKFRAQEMTEEKKK